MNQDITDKFKLNNDNLMLNSRMISVKPKKNKMIVVFNEMYLNVLKNVLDFILASLAIVLLSPIMGIISLAIKIEDGGPVFFIQKRSGKNGKIFNLYKFRSMIVSNDVHDFSKENKYTKVGKFLRKTSLDELPQLFCILKNDMSFIGPRPWIEDYNKYFTDNQRRRLEVKPGLSGLAQTNNRNNISIQEKIQWDVYYVDNVSFLMDIKVLFKTFLVVLDKNASEMPKSGIKDELETLKNQNY